MQVVVGYYIPLDGADVFLGTLDIPLLKVAVFYGAGGSGLRSAISIVRGLLRRRIT